MSDIEYVREEDVAEYHNFCFHHVPSLGRNLPHELWHYTDAGGLIAILQSGKIWSTQITCLNDTLEFRYFGDLVHEAVKLKLAQNTDKTLDPLFRIADKALSNRDLTAFGQFVACFSEIEDDLGQWRGYGGGECGYAIGFESQGIINSIKSRNSTLLMPMNYEDDKSGFLVEEVIKWAEIYFKNGLGRGLPDAEIWAQKFIAAYGDALTFIACAVKHPKFSGEAERRIVTFLQAEEDKVLQFRQKRTLLARHLPLNLTVSSAQSDKPRLPLTKIYVGPGPAQKVSKISVGDLLKQCGYDGIPVEVSKVPYRIP